MTTETILVLLLPALAMIAAGARILYCGHRRLRDECDRDHHHDGGVPT